MLCFRPPKGKGKKGPKSPKSPGPAAAKAAPAKASPAPAQKQDSVMNGSVPENILKKQQRDAKLLKHLVDQRAEAKKARVAARKAAADNAAAYA